MKTLSSEQFYANHYGYYDSLRSERVEYMNTIDSCIVDNFEKGPVLDIGCGDGLRSLQLKNKMNVDFVGLDSCVEMCKRAKKNGVQATIKENIECLSEKTINQYNGHFGAILCLWNVLGHILDLEDRRKAIKNMAALLEFDGMLFIDVNNRFNVVQYGIHNVLKNVVSGIVRKNRGIFSISINSEISKVYIASKDELYNLLIEGGFIVERLLYVNYQNGIIKKTQFKGQLFAICRKKKI